MDEVKALQAVNFDWTLQLDSIWRDSAFHAPGLHEAIRTALVAALTNKTPEEAQNPLGRVITGPAGAGKTHLLSALRREVAAIPAWFVLVDMTDVRDFWETVLLGYINSLQQKVSKDQPQFHYLLEQLFAQQLETRPAPANSSKNKWLVDLLRSTCQWLEKQHHRLTLAQPTALPPQREYRRNLLAAFLQNTRRWLGKQAHKLEIRSASTPLQELAGYKREPLAAAVRDTINRLGQQYHLEVREHQDAIRALLLLNSEDFELADIGYSWLQGLAIEGRDQDTFGFKYPQQQSSKIVKSLSWLMSLQAPTLLAFDQLDAIVTQRHLAGGAPTTAEKPEEQQVSQAIIEGIAGGLMAVRDTVSRTLTVVACLESTWEILRGRVLTSATDRFEPPQTLPPINSARLAEEIVTHRLSQAYRLQCFSPPYPSWPFQPQAFATAATLLPRELLKRCEEHRTQCLQQGQIIELTTFERQPRPATPPASLPAESKLDQAFAALCRQAPLQELLAEQAEDQILSEMVQTACRCLLRENPLPDTTDAVVDTEFPGGSSYQSLHARIRLVDHSQGDREKHYCFRALQKTHAVAYQNRLHAALTASGIDRHLPFRKLIIVRSTPLPSGRVTQRMTNQFTRAGGKFIFINEQELRTLWALYQMERQNPPDFEFWLQKHRPTSQLRLMQEAKLTKPDTGKAPPSNPAAGNAPPPSPSSSSAKVDPQRKAATRPPSPPEVSLPVGQRLAGRSEPVAIPLPLLTKHIAILAGSGSGKTVLLRRLVEEAALQGVPSIVIDSANDLACMGDPWPQPPVAWTREETEKAARYQRNTEVVIWTPGQERGNPLRLAPLPDLASVADHPDELNQALEMARAALKNTVAPGESARSRYKIGVLASALKYFATQGGETLADLIALLTELPPEAGGGISNAPKLAREMADHLRAEVQSNLLLRQEGAPPRSWHPSRYDLSHVPRFRNQPAGPPQSGGPAAVSQSARHGAVQLDQAPPGASRYTAPGSACYR